LAIITGFFITLPENAEALAVQLSSGVNASNFSLFLHRKYRNFNLIPAFPWMEVASRALLSSILNMSHQNCGKNWSIYSNGIYSMIFILIPF
jgi:hypothetical protein